MASEPTAASASIHLADVLGGRLSGGASSVTDEAVRAATGNLLRIYLTTGPTPLPDRVIGFELDLIGGEPGMLQIDGWLVLEAVDGPHRRRPVVVGFKANGEGVVRIASPGSDRELDREPVHAAALMGSGGAGWATAIFVGRARR